MTDPVMEADAWFALWEGVRLPCVEAACCRFARWGAADFRDPGVDDDPRWGALLGLIRREGRVVAARGARGVDGERPVPVAVFEAHDARVENGALVFQLGRRLAEFGEGTA